MRYSMILATLSLLAACGGHEFTASDGARQSVGNATAANLPGTYRLVTVNGAALPLVTRAGDPRVELVSEQLVVSSGGTFTIATNHRTVDAAGGVTSNTTTDAGTYDASGATTTFHFASGNTVTAVLNGTTLTLVASTGSSATYTR